MNFINYANQGATRNQPLSRQMYDALSFLPEMGVTMEVFSGGQPAKGSGQPRVGSTRHDHGDAADVFFYKDGRRLDWSNPEDLPVFQDIVRRGRANGLTGFGAGDGYMQPGSMHVGFGNEAVWGADGKGANAPDWLRSAYYGGNAPSPSPSPQTVSTRSIGFEPKPEGPKMEPEQVGGLLGSLFPNMSADRADQLRLNINGLLHNPNQGLQRGVEARMAERSQNRERQQAAAQANQQANRTLAVMRQQGAPEYLIAAAEAGNVKEAFQEFLRQRGQGPERIKGTEINGQLVNPVTGEVMGDYRSQDAEMSAAEEEIGRLMETGLDRETAIRARDRYTVSRDPITGAAVLVDKATGQTVGGEQVQEVAPGQTQNSDLSFSIGAGDRTDAFGAEGVLKRGVNAGADFLGLGVPFEDVQTTQSEFGVLRESLINDIASAYPRQPPSWLLKNIEALTPTAGTGMGAGAAQSKLEAIRRNFQNELVIAQNQANRRVTPTQRQELEQRVLGLQAAIERVNGALGAFGSQGQRQTSSGITYEVIE